MTTTTTTWEAAVNSDVFAGPMNEDGETPDQLSFYVVVTNERGDRFRSCLCYTTLDMYRDVAERLARRFCVNVVRALEAGADPTKSAKWSPTRPMYGSAAYSAANEIAWEKRCDEEAGWR
jgi:hypothetical protein